MVETTPKKQNYLIHLIYAGSFLLAVLLVVSYLFWSKNQVTIQHREHEEQIRIKEQNRMTQEKERQIKIKFCMNKAMELYSHDWALVCIQQNERNKKAFDNCRNQADALVKAYETYITSHDSTRAYNYKVAQCKGLYSYSNKPSLNCTLPATLADGVNAGLKRYEQTCRETI
jgi:hypothetical protein